MNNSALASTVQKVIFNEFGKVFTRPCGTHSRVANSLHSEAGFICRQLRGKQKGLPGQFKKVVYGFGDDKFGSVYRQRDRYAEAPRKTEGLLTLAGCKAEKLNSTQELEVFL